MIRAVLIILALTLSIASANVHAKSSHTYSKSYHIYKKVHRNGNVYIGRTSGSRGPAGDVKMRDKAHHMSKEGFKGAEVLHSSRNKAAIRGQEQRLIDHHRKLGNSGNKINGISPKNPRREHYLNEARKEFGE